MSQSFIKKPDNGPHSALGGLGVLASDRPQPPCTICGTQTDKHGTFPTCATHPYTADENCQHVIGARCAGAECRNGCVRARGALGASLLETIVRVAEDDGFDRDDRLQQIVALIEHGTPPTAGVQEVPRG